MNHPASGRFVWIDVMSKDKDADLAFFGELVGWAAHEQDMGDFSSYTTLQAGEHGIGGIVAMPAEEGHPSHLVGYCIVDDLEHSLSRARALGGKTFVPPTSIPEVGTFSVIGDPSGAVFAPMQSASDDDMAPQSPPGPGHVVWWELVSNDVEGASSFYREVVGWSASQIDMEGQPYWLWSREGESMNPAGMTTPPAGYEGPAFWLYYVWVEDVDGATDRVESLGGQVLMQAEDVPNQGRMSVIASPSGAQLALFTPLPRG